jgi:hypothetical protein
MPKALAICGALYFIPAGVPHCCSPEILQHKIKWVACTWDSEGLMMGTRSGWDREMVRKQMVFGCVITLMGDDSYTYLGDGEIGGRDNDSSRDGGDGGSSNSN